MAECSVTNGDIFNSSAKIKTKKKPDLSLNIKAVSPDILHITEGWVNLDLQRPMTWIARSNEKLSRNK